MARSRLPLPHPRAPCSADRNNRLGSASDVQAECWTRQAGKGAITVRRCSCVGVHRASAGWDRGERGYKGTACGSSGGREGGRVGKIASVAGSRDVSADRVPGRGSGEMHPRHPLWRLLHRAIVAPIQTTAAGCGCQSVLACASPKARLRAFYRAALWQDLQRRHTRQPLSPPR